MMDTTGDGSSEVEGGLPINVNRRLSDSVVRYRQGKSAMAYAGAEPKAKACKEFIEAIENDLAPKPPKLKNMHKLC